MSEMSESKIKILVIRHNEEPELTEIENDYKAISYTYRSGKNGSKNSTVFINYLRELESVIISANQTGSV